MKRQRNTNASSEDGPIETLTYRDPFAGVYKKYIFSADGKHLLGGMMVGDTGDYIKLLSIAKKKVGTLGAPPYQTSATLRHSADRSTVAGSRSAL